MTCGLLLVEEALLAAEEREEAEAGLGVGCVDDAEVVAVVEEEEERGFLDGVEAAEVWRFVGGIFLFIGYRA